MNYLVPAQPAWPRSIHDFDATLLALRLNDTFVGLARMIHELCVGSRRDSASHGFSATDPHTACICEGDERRVKSKNKRGDAEFMNHPG